MLEYREKTVQEVAACNCDRCGRRMRPEDTDGEWHEKVSLAWRSGYYSVFGDETELRLDLCQHCVKAALGEWIRSTPPEQADELHEPGSDASRPVTPDLFDKLRDESR